MRASSVVCVDRDENTQHGLVMIGILILAHSRLGDALIDCATHIMGAVPPALATLTVTAKDDPVDMLQQAQQLVAALDTGHGVLILTDMFGATPSNIACRLLDPGQVEGVSGVNLPMLMRALTYRTQPLAMVASKAQTGGQAGVLFMNEEICNAQRTDRNH